MSHPESSETPITRAEKRVQLWSCGGGRQSAGIAALIVEGKLPKPDHVCMVALECEVRSANELRVRRQTIHGGQ